MVKDSSSIGFTRASRDPLNKQRKINKLGANIRIYTIIDPKFKKILTKNFSLSLNHFVYCMQEILQSTNFSGFIWSDKFYFSSSILSNFGRTKINKRQK